MIALVGRSVTFYFTVCPRSSREADLESLEGTRTTFMVQKGHENNLSKVPTKIFRLGRHYTNRINCGAGVACWGWMIIGKGV